MTELFVTHTIKQLLHETHVRGEVKLVLSDVVMAVEHCCVQRERAKEHLELQRLKTKCSEEAHRISELEATNKQLKAHQLEIRQKANQAKEHFIVDISQVLRESRNIYSLRERLKEMDKKLLLTSRLETELLDAKKRIKELERQNHQGKKKAQSSNGEGPSKPSHSKAKTAERVPHNLLVNVDDSFLMSTFSFLSTRDIVYTAQASRYLFKKVDSMFSIGSALCKPEWGVLPMQYTIPPSSSDKKQESSNKRELLGSSNVSQSIVGLTKQMAEELSKKLSAPELKTILSMMDNQKKLSSQLQTAQVENVTMREKLESTESARDFLIGKLKDAEYAIKSAMAEQSTLQKQAETDHEVIFYLDNQSQKLESENKELRWKCGQLEASLDLLRGSNIHNEKQILTELNELRDRLEVSENSAKSQKKILVKEVKTLRSQLETVREEKDTYWRKLQIMKEALDSSDNTTSHEKKLGSKEGKKASRGHIVKPSLFNS